MNTKTGGFNGTENSLEWQEILVVMPWYGSYHYYITVILVIIPETLKY